MSLRVGSLPRGGGARGRGDQKLRWEGSAGAQTVSFISPVNLGRAQVKPKVALGKRPLHCSSTPHTCRVLM